MTLFKEILIGVLLLILSLGAYEYLQAHDAGIKLQATLDAQKTVIDNANQQISQRDAALKQQLADYEKLRAEKLTPTQIVREIPTYIPNLPKPIQDTAPDAPTVQLPKEDLPAFRDYYLKCTECSAELANTKADLASETEKYNAKDKEEQAAIKAAKGSFWKNTGHSLIKIGIGVAVGYALGKR
jgi:hypothetical protein